MIFIAVIPLFILAYFIYTYSICENYARYRIVYITDKWICQKRIDCSNAGGLEWVEWHDMKSFDTREEAISYIKKRIDINRNIDKKVKTKIVRYFF